MNKQRLEKLFNEKQVDVVVSLSAQTRLWYTNVIASAGFLFMEKAGPSTLIIDGRYIEYARRNARNVDVVFFSKENLEGFAQSKKYRTIGVEQEYLTLAELDRLKKTFPNANFVPVCAQEFRILKSEEEVSKIKKACQISLRALNALQKEIKPGRTELEIDHKLNQLLLEQGASKPAFDSIVVAGKNTSLPHGKASDNVIKDGDIVTVDFGALFEGFAADITRTFFVGAPQSAELAKILTIVKEAQRKGIEAVKPGVTTWEIDKICRDHITKQGYGKYFVHATGHGLGVDVHELPSVSSVKTSAGVLEPGMVITVEPGIYVPNLGGARMEDDILVTESGYERLSKIRGND